jgi:hypothetical protein
MKYPKTEIATGVSQWGLSATEDFKFPYLGDWNFVVSPRYNVFNQRQMTDLELDSLGIGWKDSRMSRRCTVMKREVIFRRSPARRSGLLTLLTFLTSTLEVSEHKAWPCNRITAGTSVRTALLPSYLTRCYFTSSRPA